MDKLIAQFPKQIADGLEIAQNATLNTLKGKSFSNVVICGMGGSGIGGKMVAQWFLSQADVPVQLVQSYEIPGFVNENSLVIGSSYSGNTEETLTAVKKAHHKGATIICISSGGEIIRFCKTTSSDYIKVPGGNPPRSMVAFSVIQLIKILSDAKIIDQDALHQIDHCRHVLNSELISIKEDAQRLAKHIYKKWCVLYGNTEIEPVLIRARQQFNENSKQLCWHHVIPEMNHNELVGWGGGDSSIAPVFFVSQFLSSRNKLRLDFSIDAIGKKTNNILSINGKGNTLIEESFYFIHIVDWASLYLATMNNVDPVEINIINELKESLSQS